MTASGVGVDFFYSCIRIMRGCRCEFFSFLHVLRGLRGASVFLCLGLCLGVGHFVGGLAVWGPVQGDMKHRSLNTQAPGL